MPISPAQERPLWDPGMIAVVLGGPLLKFFYNREKTTKKATTVRELIRDARHRPQSTEQAILLNATRAAASMYLVLAGLPILILGGLASNLDADWLLPILAWLVVIAVFLGMFFAACLLLGGIRWSLAAKLGKKAFSGQPGGTIARWLITPSILDYLPATWFAIAFGSQILHF